MLGSVMGRLKKYSPRLSDSQIRRARAAEVAAYRLFVGGNMPRLAALLRCEKLYGIQHYGPHYVRHFAPLRKKKLNILEIGIGGYENPRFGGSSLRTWRAYFKNANVYAIDLADGSMHEQRGIKTFRGDQGDVGFLNDVADRIGPLDIVIDDGSHLCRHIILGFKTLFPRLAADGLYVVEDTQTSYWGGFGGDTQNLNNPNTTMGYFKGLADGINYAEYELGAYSPTDFDRTITGIHFYRSILFVQKGDNTAPSNIFGKRW